MQLVKEALDCHRQMMINQQRFNSRYKSIWKFIMPFFGNMKIHEIPKYKVEEYYNKRKIKRQSVAKEIAMLNASLNYCYKMEYIEKKPRLLDASYKNETRNVWLTLDEIQKILKSDRIKRNPHIEMAK